MRHLQELKTISILERCLQEGTDKITNDMVKNLVGLPKLESINNILNNVLDYNIEQSLQSVNEVLADGKDISNLIWEIIKYVKDILVYKTTGKVELYNEEELAEIKKLAGKATKERLLDIIFYLSDLSNQLKMSTQRTIMFQVAIMKLCNKNLEASPNKNAIEQTPLQNSNISNSSDALNKINEGTPNSSNENVDSRLSNLENKLQKTVDAVQKLIKNPEIIHSSEKNVDNSTEKISNKLNRSSSDNHNIKNLITTQTGGTSVQSWGKIVKDIKEDGKVMLYSSLANSNAYELNDMTVGISFPDGLTPFGKSVIAKSENISEITKLVSMEYGKPMQIRLIDNSNEKPDDGSMVVDSIVKDLGLPLNIID